MENRQIRQHKKDLDIALKF